MSKKNRNKKNYNIHGKLNITIIILIPTYLLCSFLSSYCNGQQTEAILKRKIYLSDRAFIYLYFKQFKYTIIKYIYISKIFM